MTLFLDLKEAFDIFNYKVLFDKLEACGVKGTTLVCFGSYLDEGKQFCRVNGQKSQTMKVLCGIPQGYCLSPLLFIIYLNDFEDCMQFSATSMYADDKHTTISARDTEELVP